MKKLLSFAFMCFMCLISAVVMAADVAVDPVESKTYLEILTDNWIVIGLSLIPVIEIIVRLTPTKKDDTFLSWLFKLFPNLKKGGGTHEGK